MISDRQPGDSASIPAAAAALRQRPDTGLLAGLWEYPHVPGALAEAEAARPLQMWGVSPTKWTKKLSARHIFTHVRWEMTGYVVEVDGLGPGDWLWAEAQPLQLLCLRLLKIYRRAERGRMTWHSYTSNTGRWAPARPPTP